MTLQVLGMFLLRVVLGAVFIAHGWAKVSGIEGTIGFFAGLGLPAFMAYVVAYVEFLGGIALVLGLCTRVAAYLIAAIMVGAIVTVKFAKGFAGGYEFDLILLVSALLIAWSGSSPWSVSRLLPKKTA